MQIKKPRAKLGGSSGLVEEPNRQGSWRYLFTTYRLRYWKTSSIW